MIATALIVAAVPVRAQLFTLEPSADTYLKSGSSNQNQGSDGILRLQATGSNRTLLRMSSSDIAQAVGQGRLVSATLELYIQSNADNWGSGGGTVDVHRLLTDWTESGATWSCAIDTAPGNSHPDCDPEWDGGTFVEEPTDTVLHTNGFAGWVQLDVTEDVAGFLAGQPNDGWIVKKTDESQNGKVEYTSREGTAGQHPRLVLLVESADDDIVPPSLAIVEPASAVLVNDTSPSVVVEYSDGGSGVDLATLAVAVDGVALSGCTPDAASATCPTSALVAGSHTLHASLRDHAGNLAEADRSFELLVGPGVATVSLEAVADSYLRQGSPNQSQGGDSFLRLRSSGHDRALVRFDETAIESALSGATLRSATLELTIAANGDNWGSAGRTVEAHRLTQSWTEASVTWSCPIDSDPGNQQPDCAAQWNGGAYDPTPAATVLHTNGLRGSVDYDVTTDVRAFLAGTPGYGWLLRKTAEGASGLVDYASREGAASDRPRLILVLDVPGGGDTTAPTVSLVSPPEPRIVNLPRPHLAASFSDAGSGIDPASVHLTVDGADRTAEASITGTSLDFTPAADLADGGHDVAISVRDLAGNEAQATATVTVDTQPPSVTIESPEAQVVSGSASLAVTVAFDDGTSGVDLDAVRVLVDGQDLAASCELGEGSVSCMSQDLVSGQHLVSVTLADFASNQATVERTFDLTVDVAAPVVTLTSPADGALVDTPTLTVQGGVSDDGPVVEVLVNGSTVELVGGAFSASVPLLEGPNEITVVAVDSTGKQGAAAAAVTLDTSPPTLALRAPAQGQLVNGPAVRVEGTALDENGVTTVAVNGVAVTPVEGLFASDAPVSDGANTIVVQAFDAAGNVQETSVEVVGFSVPQVEITDPPSLAYLATTTVDVSGTVSPPGSSVTVNGVAAEVEGATFTAHDVPLVEGGNILTASAIDAGGHESTDSINVVRDLTPPHLQVDLPADGSTVYEDSVSVSGLVNDIVPGTVNAGQVAVTVNGVVAQVSNRSFFVAALPLAPGDNTIAVDAIDASGNTGHTEITVHHAPATVPRVKIASGDHQTATIGALLAQPLTVVLLDASGLPVAGRSVLFRLRQSNGHLEGGRRQVAVATGLDGTASVHFTLGTRAGAGAQRVEAEAAGFAGPAVFTATALPGAPALIVVDSGGGQSGIAGRPLPRPLIAAVTDPGFNRLAGVPVRFAVVRGAGGLDDGPGEKVITTDSDGRAIVRFTLDTEEGVSNNVVEARVDGLEASPLASWTASGMTAGDPALTSISGVVLDNTNLPIPGATVRLRDTSIVTQTDEQGAFHIAPAPVGTLYLIVDGSTVTRPGAWPDLELVVTTIPGREKTLPMSVYLLPIDLQNGLFVSETQGGTLTLPNIPGFALDIQPGSVTFPGGGRSGVVSVTMVHSDRVPMTPSFGQQPRLIVTIQPAGARFDPPARLTLPNVEGLAPGEVTDLYSFDHDLGHFVSIGPGTVSEDGALIVSDPGVGIVKAGWHCGGNPSSSGTAHDCGPCGTCPPGQGSHCVPTSGASCDDHDACTVNDRCQSGTCAGDRRLILSVMAKGDGMNPVETHREKEVTFTAEQTSQHCASVSFDWDFGDGATATGPFVSHAYSAVGSFTARVTAACLPCASETKTDTVPVQVKTFEVEIKKPVKNQHFDMQADPPAMPEVKAMAAIVGLDPDPTDETDFRWTVSLTLDPESSHCSHGPLTKVEHPKIEETVTGPDYMPQFQQLMSGDLVFNVEATIDGDTDDDELDGVDIRGTNPPRSAIYNRMPHDTLRRIACQESRFRQFDAAPDGGMSKCPLYSMDGLGGVGVMQLTNPKPTMEQTFDWRANVDRGIVVFDGKVAAARGYPGQLRSQAVFIMLEAAFNDMREAMHLPRVNVVLPDFTSGDFDTNLKQLEDDSIRGYNGFGGALFGIHLHEFRPKMEGGQLVVVVDEQAGVGEVQWEPVPVNDRPHNYGIPDYVNEVKAHSPSCE